MNNRSKQKVDYGRYMASREWSLKKKEVRERSCEVCERCGLAPHTVTHHLTYEHLGDEPLEDLQGICQSCHSYLHGDSPTDPAAVTIETKKPYREIFFIWMYLLDFSGGWHGGIVIDRPIDRDTEALLFASEIGESIISQERKVKIDSNSFQTFLGYIPNVLGLSPWIARLASVTEGANRYREMLIVSRVPIDVESYPGWFLIVGDDDAGNFKLIKFHPLGSEELSNA